MSSKSLDMRDEEMRSRWCPSNVMAQVDIVRDAEGVKQREEDQPLGLMAGSMILEAGMLKDLDLS
jgi:hypothetical protein